ncbi:MAG TPA: START domain-containing protein [Oligoflexus sp.]|uniref:START domain-containing protein n=1 Tax=Oligoflexus sp. TaxID=1971216 RepID=UPI002D7FF492|nr:START domain-containing protein [Oligoflexus sp.]HET9240435.1 START domain-containing protein [Oligoflexus sp.]
MIARSIALAFVSLLLWQEPVSAGVKEWQNMGWQKINEEDGITVFRKSFPDSEVKGVGGECIINASVGKILWVLMDNEHKGDWVDKFKSTKTIETPSDLSNIQYAAFSMPFPVTNRDFVYRYDFSVDESINAVIVDVKSVEHPKAPAKDSIGVRGVILHGRYVLQPKGPNQTFVKAEYLADPKGILPTWVVNIVQKNWPYKTLAGLRKQVKKSFVQEWDIYNKVMKPKMKVAH